MKKVVIMKLKEALLKSLANINKPADYMTVYNHVIEKGYFNFGNSKTPESSVSAQLGQFIRDGDARVNRIKVNGSYAYYLTENENNIEIDALTDDSKNSSMTINIDKSYKERDLHKLLSSYLKITDVNSKTIFHEQSNGSDGNQTWTHPDMIGIKFLNLKSQASQAFLKSINRLDTFRLSSYELKREINNDVDLKKAYFQAVSNSSWANFGYLVAFEFSSSLTEEIERLNQSFGIGVIKLDAHPYQSKVMFPAKYRNLDFKTIDKLCKMNKDFESFIFQAEKLMTAEEKYFNSTKKELEEFCDDYFASDNDAEIEKYCHEKSIPIELEN